MPKESYDYLEIVGAKIRVARVQKRLSQAELGKAVGLDDSAISRIENGKRESVPLATIRAFADVLGVPVSSLVS